MQTIIPSILELDLDEIKRKFGLVKDACELVQIDVCDGEFVPHITFQDITQFLEFKEKVQLDVMVKNPNIDQFLDYGFQSVIFHASSFDSVPESLGEKFGLTVDINFENYKELISKADFVQVMGIKHIGKQHEPFDASCLDTIKKLRSEFPNLMIQVDGGMNETTIPLVFAAGANSVAPGSAIFGSGDALDNLKKLQSLV